ncbi:MAG: hypothetical protein KAQ62_17540, partial [Cyclobacteriaceae bacterium]|nr:hypothetical protein [Cyclobacteriaceae bacterium]
AYSGLADAYVMLCFHGYMSPDECWIEAIPAAQKSNKFGSNLGETHNTLGIIALLHDRNIESAKREFLRALEINPTHLQARAWYGLFYLTITRQKTELILEHLKIATINDPLSPYAHACYALTLCAAEKFEESITSAEYAVKLNPNAWTSRSSMGSSYLWSGQLDKALQENLISLKLSNRSAWSLHLILITYLKMNQRGEALKIFKEMEVRYRDHYLPPSNLAIAAASLGKDEYALELAHTSLNIIDPYLSFTATIYQDSEVLREVPGIENILEQLGYSNPM